jgi:FHS family glucose/mannose:H+ symporter-like MFS transporter
VTWLASCIQRIAITGTAHAAASSSLYFSGFPGSRGASAVALLRADTLKTLRGAVFTALSASLLLLILPTPISRDVAMLVFGAALGPIYPLLIATFFARARHSSDTRWILATAGLGGSVLPWLTGWFSSHAGNLRIGVFTIPTALALPAFLLPVIRTCQSNSQHVKAATG